MSARALVLSGAAAAVTAAAIATAAVVVAAREAALDRAAGAYDVCDCRVCRGLRGSPLTRSGRSARDAALRSISPDGEL